jgi:PIN domain nuclease of toxin-antitoxin system
VRLLIDTHVLIGSLLRTSRLSPQTRNILSDRSNEVFFSAVSIWEIAIKASLRRDDFDLPPSTAAAEAVRTGFVELCLHSRTAAHVAALPFHHRDPFDRLLVAQAITHDLHLYTADAALQPYSDRVVLVS